MKESDSVKSINKPLQQFRFKIYRERNFLKKFYTPLWLKQLTTKQLIATILFWLIAVIILLMNKKDLHATGFYFLLATSAMVIMAHCIVYFKSKKKKKRLG